MSYNILKKYHIIGIVFSLIFGTLLHFLFNWSNQNAFIGIFSSVNESIWEHLKLLFWPVLIFNFIEYFIYGKDIKNFIQVKVIALILGLITIPVIFYTYSGIIGKNYLVIDILIFVIAILITFCFSYKNLQNTKKFLSEKTKMLSLLILIILISLFILFTFKQPHIGLFYDTSKDLYGIPE